MDGSFSCGLHSLEFTWLSRDGMIPKGLPIFPKTSMRIPRESMYLFYPIRIRTLQKTRGPQNPCCRGFWWCRKERDSDPARAVPNMGIFPSSSPFQVSKQALVPQKIRFGSGADPTGRTFQRVASGFFISFSGSLSLPVSGSWAPHLLPPFVAPPSERDCCFISFSPGPD